jgi:hypothetical protein
MKPRKLNQTIRDAVRDYDEACKRLNESYEELQRVLREQEFETEANVVVDKYGGTLGWGRKGQWWCLLWQGDPGARSHRLLEMSISVRKYCAPHMDALITALLEAEES